MARLPDPEAQPVLRAAELAKILRMSPGGVYLAIKRGEIPAVKVGRRTLIPTRDALQKLGLIPADAAPAPIEFPADVVAKVARYRSAGLSTAAIARTLAADEVAAPLGQSWTSSLVEAILERAVVA